MISFQTNYASMVAENNLNTNSLMQTKTVESLTSGYRINSSGDDAAGLGVANQFRDNVSELTQGVLNGNNGINTLQIIDGGLNNISTMLDRMKTLATESASGTFVGNRATLDQEYQSLKTEITQQATNIGLVSGGANAQNLAVYVGGAPNGASLNSAAVNVDLSAGLVDATSLGLGPNSTVASGGGGTIAGSATLANLSATKSVTLGAAVTFSVYSGNTVANVSLKGTATVGQFISAINSQIAAAGVSGVSADLNASTGQIQFQGSNFALSTITDAGNNLFLASGDISAAVASGSMYDTAASAYTALSTNSQNLTFTVGGQDHTIALAAGSSTADAVNSINAGMNALGIYATQDQGGNIYFEGNSQFTVTAGASAAGGFTPGAIASGATTGNGTSLNDATLNATNAITAVNNALAALANVQGTVGTGENNLQYAINLANSQITNFSAAESSIRDADVAKEAANLSKAQVIEQASVAAMAQANSTPQAVLKLLQ